MSLYAFKGGGADGGALQPWSQVLTLSQAGDGLAKLAALYNKRTETSVTGTLQLPSELDGPMHVAVWDKDVTLNGATITVLNKCRGLFCLFLGNVTVTGSASKIHMDGMASVNKDWENYDISIPKALSLSSDMVSQAAIMNMVREKNYFVGDPQLWKDLSPTVFGSITPGTNLIVDKTQLGAAGAGTYAGGGPGFYQGGGPGAGANGPGGGCTGSFWQSINNPYALADGEKARSWRGGFSGHYLSGGGSWSHDYTRQGSPSGIVIVAVAGTLTVGPGFTVSANTPQRATLPGVWGFGGIGGGRAKLLTGGTVTGSPTVQANGGLGYNQNATSTLPGGAGKADTSTFIAWDI
ncbi:hypothetical protein NNJEOMEG_02251 [Fundidesulfovibrio magnetotacticus]|uniref:Uncharacterized protein n=1 Tax=Fundidesulfovibrio magnetotacticus TaxID=2730080 RepID=A0A6V8LX77_9BACT|nr:hypothetical protein [Fundidesulfovibrio magnetotacticus]GFK94406.1 hypothetical protein NNJEOMEG_02251 [Fundidesulfovibrio magnetotacticus]